jgi:molybdate transport system substrate-binding protein
LLETFVFALAFLASASLQAAQVTISVAAAADLKFALDEITGEFQKTHNQATVQVTYGSSGNFYSQLSQRAPFDIFFSADVSYPTKLVEAGLGVADSKFSYAVGRIVAWTPTNSLIDPLKLGIESLKHPLVRKIAIANPEHAPYGKAAVAAMQKNPKLAQEFKTFVLSASGKTILRRYGFFMPDE